MSTENEKDTAVQEQVIVKETVIKEPNFGSKNVFLRRQELNEGNLPKELLADAKIRLGSVFVNRQPHRAWPAGSPEEIKYLSTILDVSFQDVKWSKTVNDYWKEMRILVPYAGKPFEIGTDESGEVLNVIDHIQYTWTKSHPHVADSVEDMRKFREKKFYIQDPSKDVVKKNDKVQLMKLADRAFIKAADNPERMRNLLRVVANVRVDNMKHITVENMLYDIKNTSPMKFLEAAMDKNLDIRAEVSSFIEMNVLTQIGNTIIHLDETIADNIDECITVFKNPKNSGLLNTLRVKYKEKIR